MKFIRKIEHAFSNIANSWSTEEWIIAVCVMLAVGVICMKGFGSRKNY